MVAQEHDSWSDVVLLCDFIDTLVLEQRRASATERAVCCDVDALFLAKVDDFLLGAQWVVLDLVDRGDNGRFGE